MCCTLPSIIIVKLKKQQPKNEVNSHRVPVLGSLRPVYGPFYQIAGTLQCHITGRCEYNYQEGTVCFYQKNKPC